MDANEWLMSSGAPSVSWKDKPVGFTVTGTINGECSVQQQRDYDSGEPDFWDEAKTQPKMMLVVPLKTDLRDPTNPDDDGERRLFVQGKSLTEGMRQAVRRSGRSGLETGGQVTVTYTGDGPQPNKRLNPPKLFSVEYRPPADRVSASFLADKHMPGTSSNPTATMSSNPPPLSTYTGGVPAGISPAAWEALPAEQRSHVLAALGGRSEAPPF